MRSRIIVRTDFHPFPGFIGLVIGLCLIIIICCSVVIILLRKPEPTPADRARRRRQMHARDSSRSFSGLLHRVRHFFSRDSDDDYGDGVPAEERGFSLERGRKIIRGLSLTSNDRRVRGWLQASGDDWDDADEDSHWRRDGQRNMNRWSGSTFSGEHDETRKGLYTGPRVSPTTVKEEDEQTQDQSTSRLNLNPVRAGSPEAFVRPAGAAMPVVVSLHHPDRQESMTAESGMTPSTEGPDSPGHSRHASADTGTTIAVGSPAKDGRTKTRDSSMTTMTSPTSSIWTFERGTKFKENI
jgi:hypothetical protein